MAPHPYSIFYGDNCNVDNCCSNDTIKYNWEKLTKFDRNAIVSRKKLELVGRDNPVISDYGINLFLKKTNWN